MEVSAKTGKNITEALEEIAKNTYEKFHSLRRYTSSFSLDEKVKKVKFKKKKTILIQLSAVRMLNLH